MSTAIVIGATGLVGKCLVRQLLEDPRYHRVVALVRRATALRADKYEEHVVTFDQPESFAELVKGEVLFSAMGTTRAQAGSVAAQRVVDYTYQFEVARLAAKNGVRAYVLVSSGGANSGSLYAYLQMKGDLERDVRGLGFETLQILQPGPLTGDREQPRLAERISVGVLGALGAVGLFRGARPITGERVASAMRRVAGLDGVATHAAGELFALSADGVGR